MILFLQISDPHSIVALVTLHFLDIQFLGNIITPSSQTRDGLKTMVNVELVGKPNY